jgi:hypothetical protein
MPASDLFVLALVVLCIAIVAVAALRSRETTKVPSSETTSVDLEGSRIGSDNATTMGLLAQKGNE